VNFPDIDPFIIGQIPAFELFGMTLGPLGVRWYALAYVLGIILGWRYALKLVRGESLWEPGKPPANGAQIDDLILWLTLGIIGGGRLGYAAFYQPSMFLTPVDILKLWDGGMSFHGGLIGVVVAIVWYAAANPIGGLDKGWLPPAVPAKASFSAKLKAALSHTGAKALTLGDVIAACAPIGLFFGRIANFINGELWGRHTDLPWGIIFCNQTIERTYGGDCPAGLYPRHPSQLYEAALEGIFLFFLLRWATHVARKLPNPGFTTGLFLIGYGVIRGLLELVREPDAHMPEALKGMLTMGLLLSIPMVLVGAWLVWRSKRTAARA
jgi:phosphatidylglycerol:prolipoprotein diacylglycerol transferase